MTLYAPVTRLLAAELRLAVTVAEAPPGVSAPLAGETLSQSEVLAMDQFNEFVPALVRVKLCEVIVNGPPARPLEVNPVVGVIWRASGLARALIRFCPDGVPQPVQRS